VIDLDLRAVGAKAVAHAAVPTLQFDIDVEEKSGQSIESIALHCQLRIEPQRRAYSHAEEQKLLDLFGETPRWGDTQKPFLWTHAYTLVGAFRGTTRVALPVPCTYDLEVAGSKYLHGLDLGGEIPLLLLFSGTVFVRGEAGLEALPLPWHKESSLRMPVATWRELMDLYFPGTGWLRLERDTLDALGRFKAGRAIPTYDRAILLLLEKERP
jgi:Family of unknown function (DUF6084)